MNLNNLMAPKNRRYVILGGCLVVLAAVLGVRYVVGLQHALPSGIVSSNGRLEADEIAIATKYPGRIAELKFQEGDRVTAGQVLARMDTTETEASLREAKSEFGLAETELKRALELIAKDAISQQRVDQLRTMQDKARAEIDRLEHQISDATLVAPKPGRMLYKLADIGETLPAGGQVGTMIDLSEVYMTMFVTSAEAARTSMGASGRIVIDAVPNRPIPAQITYISPRAQFTPKQVETQTERERMMFRVKLRIPPALIEQYADRVKTGVTGVGYIQLDPKAVWPGWLESDLTRSAAAK